MNLRLVSAREPIVQERPVDARPFIDLKSVSLSYDAEADSLTVDRVSMGIGQGEFVAVVGPSGCGKSTLMKLVTGLLPATSGEVIVDGNVVHRPIKGVGMAFQNATLLPWRTTLKNVLLPLEIVQPFKKERRRKRAEHEARAQAMLDAVGLGSFGAKFPWQLSGGMQQRANLCRALVHEPKLLMLDEPFAALDAFTREELWGIMQTLWLQHRFSAILVTHDLREAVYLADRVFVMSKKPARVIFERKIDLPRPRTIEGSFEPHFIDLVHELRGKIIEARS
jgi:NitT/TauT family transport system ATP-binding protein